MKHPPLILSLICTISFSVFAKDSPDQGSKICANVLAKENSEGREKALEDFEKYLTFLPFGLKSIAARGLNFDYESLRIILEMAQGVRNEEGKVIQSGLSADQLKDLIELFLPLTKARPGLLVRIYSLNDGNIQQTYKQLHVLHTKVSQALREGVLWKTYLDEDEVELMNIEKTVH